MNRMIFKNGLKIITLNRLVSTYDVVILGGGMVGFSMALSLGKLSSFFDKKILLIEAEKETRFDNSSNYKSRVCALSPATHQLLNQIGAWKNIEKLRHRPIKYMQVWDACGPSCISFGNHSDENLAYVVENDVITTAITSELKLSTNVHIRYNSKAVKIGLRNSKEKADELLRVTLDDGSIIEANLLIGADGADSQVRKAANIDTVSCKYNQHAVVAVLTLDELDSNNTAWQRFLPSGPIALLPLSTNQSCLIWSTTSTQANQLINSTKDEFIASVNNAFINDTSRDDIASIIAQGYNLLIDALQIDRTRHRLPPLVLDMSEDSRAMFPLSLHHATHYVLSNVALIGDACHRLHPLSGQGLNLGFGDVSYLTKVLDLAATNGIKLGSIHHLIDYETNRQREVVPMLLTIDSINRIYSNQLTPIIAARNIVCQLFDAAAPIKKMMTSIASGIRQ